MEPMCPDDIVVADAGERSYTLESQKGWAAEIENMGWKGGDADSGMIEIPCLPGPAAQVLFPCAQPTYARAMSEIPVRWLPQSSFP